MLRSSMAFQQKEYTNFAKKMKAANCGASFPELITIIHRKNSMLDLLIKNALVVDGTGAPSLRQSVGIKDGKIVLDVESESSKRTLDASDLVLCPGFID